MEPETELRIQLFGPLQIKRHGRTLPLPPSRAARSLLAWLLLHPEKQHARAALLGVFWPDMPEADARRALTQALWQIRRAAPDLVQADRASISLNPDTAVFTDALTFRKLLHPGQPPETAPERLRQAVELAQGELLEGFYDDWIFPEREQLREQYLQALGQLAQIEKQNGRYRQALAAISQINQSDPLRESAWQERMRLHAALEQPETALEQYERYRRILAEELDAQPQPETTALAQAIARQSGSQPIPFIPAPAEQLDPPALNAAASLPLIGRAAERNALLRQITAVLNRQGGVIFISGAAGVGKSRLLQETAEAAAWRGMQTAWGYAQDQAAAPPFGPLIQALDAALSPLRIQQIRRLLPELWLAAAAPLLPNVTSVLPHLPPLPFLSPDQEPLRQLEALTRLILALGEIAPQIVIVEDLHWADQHTLDALTYLARRLAGSRVLLLGSFRQEDAQENEAVWRGLQAIEAAGLRLRLPPLAADSVAELVRQGLSLPQIAPRFSQRIYRQCGGNPFHVLETLRALRDNGLLYRDEQGVWHTPYDDATSDYAELPIPAASEQVIRQRLDRLTAAARLTAQTAALIGRQVDFLLLETAVPLETRETLAALGVLAQRQFLQETAVGYQFSHDQIRHTLLTDLPPDLARELHGRIAAALEQFQPDQIEALAWHYTEARQAEKAIYYNQAVGILQAALWQRETAGDLAGQEYIHWQLGPISMEQGNAEQADDHFRRALELAQTIGYRYREAVIHVNWGNLLWMQNKFSQTLEHYRAALNILAETGQRRAEAQILTIWPPCSAPCWESMKRLPPTPTNRWPITEK